MVRLLDWNISAGHFPAAASLRERLLFLCNYAAMAPSVHNIQPWLFHVTDDAVQIRLNPKRLLVDGDPTGREAWISIGCCFENLLLAAGEHGLSGRIADARFAPGAGEVTIQFVPAPAHEPEWKVLEAIVGRRTDRSRYGVRKLSREDMKALSNGWTRGDAQVEIVTHPAIIEAVADLTSRGIGMALRFPGFRRELASLIRPTRSHANGIVGKSLELGLLRSLLEPMRVKHGVGVDRQAKTEYDNMKSAAAIVLVLAKGDTPKYWLEAGRALEHTGLVATTQGLSTATTAAVVEASDFHTDVERLLDTQLRLQAVMRVGYSSRQPARPAPRYHLDDLIT
jgi:nitroreductase